MISLINEGLLMAKGKLKDFLGSLWVDGSQALIESNVAQNAITELGSFVVEEGTALAIGAVFAGFMPRVNGIHLVYQQKRFERNIKEAVEVLNSRVDLIDRKIQGLESEVYEKFRGLYVEWMLDNLHEEKQIEKVKYHINGYINMMENSTTDDIMLLFMENLNQLTNLDIDVLRMYVSAENYIDVCKRHGIDYDQLELVKEKLERHGLLASRNDDQRDGNIDVLAEYIVGRVKEENKRNGDFHKIRLGKIQKVRKSDSYFITRLGREFLDKVS